MKLRIDTVSGSETELDGRHYSTYAQLPELETMRLGCRLPALESGL